ncbi:MAG: hypothetical protein Q8N91_06945 [Candidatus Omnitrophota bacterium]|nr:hypothetical protein [Candidatus Omnitrophota bacterium]
MRHVRTRRRFQLILALLFAFCMVLFCESRIEAFVPQLKDFAEAKIGHALGDRFNFSIGSIDGGILRPVIFNNVTIKDRKGPSIFDFLVITQVRTNYRIWDALLKRNYRSMLFAEDSGVYVNFSTRDNGIEGFLQLRGDLARPEIKGSLNLFDKGNVDFAGRINGDSFDIEIRPLSSGVVKAEGSFGEEGVLAATFKINHIMLGGFDLVCDANSKFRFVDVPGDPKNSYFEGEFATKNLILNFKPFLDLKAYYKISGGILQIDELSIGEILRARGKAMLKEPFNVDMSLEANNVNLGWFLNSLGVDAAASILAGTMNGKFDFKGPIKNLKSAIHIDIRKGQITDLDFESLSANLKGDGPYIRIDDSRITRESGYFALAGEMDLRRIGKNSIFTDITISTDEKAITWDGWNSSRVQDVQEVRMKKKITEEMNIDFKKIIAEETIDESVRANDEIHLEYKLDAKDSLRMMVGRDSEFFGLEHKDRF